MSKIGLELKLSQLVNRHNIDIDTFSFGSRTVYRHPFTLQCVDKCKDIVSYEVINGHSYAIPKLIIYNFGETKRIPDGVEVIVDDKEFVFKVDNAHLVEDNEKNKEYVVTTIDLTNHNNMENLCELMKLDKDVVVKSSSHSGGYCFLLTKRELRDMRIMHELYTILREYFKYKREEEKVTLVRSGEAD